MRTSFFFFPSRQGESHLDGEGEEAMAKLNAKKVLYVDIAKTDGHTILAFETDQEPELVLHMDQNVLEELKSKLRPPWEITA